MMLSASYNNECLVCLTKMRSAACGLRRAASATATAYTPDSAIRINIILSSVPWDCEASYELRFNFGCETSVKVPSTSSSLYRT